MKPTKNKSIRKNLENVIDLFLINYSMYIKDEDE